MRTGLRGSLKKEIQDLKGTVCISLLSNFVPDCFELKHNNLKIINCHWCTLLIQLLFCFDAGLFVNPDGVQKKKFR